VGAVCLYAGRNDQAWVTAKDAVHDPNSQLAVEIA